MLKKSFKNNTGIGLRHPHYKEFLEKKPDVGWVEVHSENFFGEGRRLDYLLSVREHYPVSLHGVGLSLGSATTVDEQHLRRLSELIQKVEPCMVSDHLSWSRLGKAYYPDLFPIFYTQESFDVFSENIQKAQDFLKRTLLIENPSSYIIYQESTWDEADFLVALAKKTGAQLLLDVNNVFVSSMNHDWDAIKYIQKIPSDLVKEIHVAGHSTRKMQDFVLRIDTHDRSVCSEVWDLYARTIQLCGPTPTLLEWDEHIPSLDDLLSEAAKINEINV